MDTAASQGEALQGDLLSALRDESAQRPAAFVCLGHGDPAIATSLRALEPKTQTLWSAQLRHSFGSALLAAEANHQSLSRGVRTRTIYGDNALSQSPIATSLEPDLRLGPVIAPFMVLDGRALVFSGHRDEAGQNTAFMSSRPNDVQGAIELFETIWAKSRPGLPDGQQPLLTRRQATIALHISSGMTDEAVARRLGLSVRSIGAEVSAIAKALGAPSRVAAFVTLAAAMPSFPART